MKKLNLHCLLFQAWATKREKAAAAAKNEDRNESDVGVKEQFCGKSW